MKITARGIVCMGEAGCDYQSLTFPMVCVSSSGRWLCAFRGAPAKVSNHGQRPMLTWSDDRGVTWRSPNEPFQPESLDGRPGRFRFAALTCLDDGRILAALNWVDESQPDAPYFNEETEGLLDTRVYLAYSGDEGETWGRPQLMDTAPFHVPTPLTGPILKLQDGDLACQLELNKSYEDPSPWKHASVLLFSSDQGKTWPRHCVVTQDPANEVFYWDQRPTVLADGSILDAFWTYKRATAEYLNIHIRRSRDGGRTWTPLHDTDMPGQPGSAFELADGMLVMPVVDRKASPKVTLRRSVDGGQSWPEEDCLLVYDSAGASQSGHKTSMQDAWAEMYAFSVGLPNTAPMPGGGALLVYYAGERTDHTGIHWATVQ